ncbi:MAG: hypothetical protein IT373_06980, partial [Polyangiaceae bacterium]|nr:hypothetical protein [Polyangiaceae bacterium]
MKDALVQRRSVARRRATRAPLAVALLLAFATYGSRDARAQPGEPTSATMVRFALPDALRATPGLVIYFDGIPIRRAAWDEPMPVSPGSHTVTLRGDGKRREKLRVEVASGGAQTIALPTELVPAPSSPVTPDYGLPRAKVGPAMRDGGIALTVIGTASLVAGVACLKAPQNGRKDNDYFNPAGLGLIIVPVAAAELLVGIPLWAVGQWRLDE